MDSRTVIRLLLLIAILALPGLPATAQAQTNWISDVLHVPLRSGPSARHRIVHRGLPSGTPVTVISRDEENRYALVRTEGGTEGYIGMQYLSPEPIAALKLERAEQQIRKLLATRSPMQLQLTELEESNAELKRQNETLTTEKTKLSEELEHIRKISANTVAIDRRNQELLQQNRELKNQIDELNAENGRLQDASGREWFKLGAGAILLGMFMGVVLPYFKPRKKPQTGGWV